MTRTIFSLCICALLPVTAAAQFTISLEAPEAPSVIEALPFSEKELLQGYVDDEVIVKYHDTVSLTQAVGEDRSLEVRERFASLKIDRMHITDGKSVSEKVRELSRDAAIEYAEPNYLRLPATIDTNDPLRTDMWGLDNTGQTVDGISGTADADIDAPEAWAYIDGVATSSVIVAIIDSGVAYNHPDLAANMWDGTSCVDEGGSALGGCVHGYDFADDDLEPLPEDSVHGTLVSGIVGAVGNNGYGGLGAAPDVEIMALRFNLTVSGSIRAMNFARENGAKVINASYVGTSYSTPEYTAINNFRSAGGVFVAASGNDGTDNDATPYYPAAYNLDNIIAVAASDGDDDLTSFSNYGSTSVDVAAPGIRILTPTAATDMYDEDFSGATVPALPSTFSSTSTGGYFGTVFSGSYGNLLISDVSGVATSTYASNTDATVTSDVIDLSGNEGALLGFTAICDTEDTDPYGATSDYMSVSYSSDGAVFSEVIRFNEYELDTYTDSTHSDPYTYYTYQDLLIATGTDLTSTAYLQFRWVTDADDNDYHGCLVDDIVIEGIEDGASEKYDYVAGTSMAAPQVAGLAALIWSVAPTLTYTEVRDSILNGVDVVGSHSGQTGTEGRINAYTSLASVLDTVAPAVPSALSTTSVADTSIGLTWSAVADSDLSYYNLYRDNAVVATTTTTTTTDTGLASGTGYAYAVSAVDDSGNESATSTSLVATTTSSSSLTAPSNLQETSAGQSTASFSWDAATDDVAVLGYYIYRDDTYIGTTAGLSYSDTGLSSNTTYTYIVVSYDADSNTATSSSLDITTDSSSSSGGGGGGGGSSKDKIETNAATNVEGNNATINGEVADSDDWGVYFVYSTSDVDCDDDDDAAHLLGSYDEDDTFSLTLNNLSPETTYYFRACGVDEDDDIESGDERTFTTLEGDEVEEDELVYAEIEELTGTPEEIREKVLVSLMQKLVEALTMLLRLRLEELSAVTQ